MAYRDDDEALKARIERLEAENAALQKELARLRGEIDAPGSGIERALGAPLVLRIERTIEGELGPADRERMLATLRESLGPAGSVLQLGPTLVFRTKRSMRQGRGDCSQRDAVFTQVQITSREGRTKIVITERRHAVAAMIFGIGMGAFGGGGLGAVASLTTLASPWLLFATLPGWLLTMALGARTMYAAASRRRARQLEAVATRIEDEVARAAAASQASSAGPGVRVATDDVDEDEIEAGATRRASGG